MLSQIQFSQFRKVKSTSHPRHFFEFQYYAEWIGDFPAKRCNHPAAKKSVAENGILWGSNAAFYSRRNRDTFLCFIKWAGSCWDKGSFQLILEGMEVYHEKQVIMHKPIETFVIFREQFRDIARTFLVWRVGEKSGLFKSWLIPLFHMGISFLIWAHFLRNTSKA